MHTLQLLGHVAKAIVFRSTDSATKAGVAVANHARLHQHFKNIIDVKNQVCSARLKTTEEWKANREAELGPKNAAEKFLEKLQQRAAHREIHERMQTSPLLQDALQRQCMRASLSKHQAEIESLRIRCDRYQDRLEQLSQAQLEHCEEQQRKATAKLDAAIAPHDSQLTQIEGCVQHSYFYRGNQPEFSIPIGERAANNEHSDFWDKGI